jgi:NET1-associated nuclear protein 1 (U3 small nucleolar RNA-associated protein 17)
MQSPSVLFDLEVAPSNRVSRTNERELESIAVERVAFSSDGRWMATMEGRRGDEVEGGGSVKTLKIWARNGAK